MHISGSLKEIFAVLIAAEDLKAEAVHFIAPDKVFILGRNKNDYFFAQTTITIGYTIVVPKVGLENMRSYIRVMRKDCRNKSSPHYGEDIQFVTFVTNQIVFNESDKLVLSINIPYFRLKQEVEEKILQTTYSSYQLETPYLRLPIEEVNYLASELRRYKKTYSLVKTTDNCLRIDEDGVVSLHTTHLNGQTSRIETPIEHFARNKKFDTNIFTFTDKALYGIRWLARITPVDEVIFLPRQRYCLVEGYGGSMVAKVRTMLKNDLMWEKV